MKACLSYTEEENWFSPCHSEIEPEVEALLVSDVTSNSFTLAWMAEEDIFDTFVIMVNQAEGQGQPRELVLGGEERHTGMAGLTEDTEYQIEIFGLVFGRRSKSVMERVRTGTWWEAANTKLWWNSGALDVSCQQTPCGMVSILLWW